MACQIQTAGHETHGTPVSSILCADLNGQNFREGADLIGYDDEMHMMMNVITMMMMVMMMLMLLLMMMVMVMLMLMLMLLLLMMTRYNDDVES